MQTMKKAKKLALVAMLAFATALCVAVPAAFADVPEQHPLNGGYYYSNDTDSNTIYVKKTDDGTQYFALDYTYTGPVKFNEQYIDGDTDKPSALIVWNGNTGVYVCPSLDITIWTETKLSATDLHDLKVDAIGGGKYLFTEYCNPHLATYAGTEQTVYDIASFSIYLNNGAKLMDFFDAEALKDVPDGAIEWKGVYGQTYDMNVSGEYLVLAAKHNLSTVTNRIFICNPGEAKYITVESAAGEVKFGGAYQKSDASKHVQYIYCFVTDTKKCTVYDTDFEQATQMSCDSATASVKIEDPAGEGYVYTELNSSSAEIRSIRYNYDMDWANAAVTAIGAKYPGYVDADEYLPEIEGLTLEIQEKPQNMNSTVKTAMYKFEGLALTSPLLLDIHFKNSSGNIVEYSGNVDLKIHIKTPDIIKNNLSGKYVSAFHVRDNGNLDYINSTADANYITLTTSHNSLFILGLGDPLFLSNRVYMNRLYNPNSGEHFYTGSVAERDMLVEAGWNDEGIGWVATAAGNPVYRLYNANGGEHHYTLNAAERDMLVEAGWNYEGIGWYSYSDIVPLYREYNPNAFSCNHNYTKDIREHNMLIELGWVDEGIGWYAGPYE